MDVLIIGAGGHGKVVLDILLEAGEHRPVGFIDADPALAGTSVGGLPVLGAINALPKLRVKAKGAIIAIGDNRTRMSYASKVAAQGFELVSAIHPAASISRSVKLGKNVVVASGATICAEATIADSVIVNTSAVVDHECKVGVGAHICPGALLAGRVRIGTGAFIGLGAKVIPCLSVGDYATIGAGAVVVRDLPADVIAVGVPARIIKNTGASTSGMSAA